MDEKRLEVLRAIADTVVPALDAEDDPDGFWARSGSAVGAHLGVAEANCILPRRILPARIVDLRLRETYAVDALAV